MEGRYPRGILLAITNCNDPSKEEEFNHWYNHIHLPDLTAYGVFERPMRFVNTNPDPGDAKYLATYETNWEDIHGAGAALQENNAILMAKNRRSPNVEGVAGGMFKRLGGEFCAARKPVRGILAILLNCKDPAREKEFKTWTTDIHTPDILDTGLYHTAYLYEGLDPESLGGKYLTIYETADSDPGKALTEIMKRTPKWEQQGRLFDGVEAVFVIAARRIWPLE